MRIIFIYFATSLKCREIGERMSYNVYRRVFQQADMR